MAKPYLDINGQIQNLTEAKGLIVNDIPYARQKLSDISYLSLIGDTKFLFSTVFLISMSPVQLSRILLLFMSLTKAFGYLLSVT